MLAIFTNVGAYLQGFIGFLIGCGIQLMSWLVRKVMEIMYTNIHTLHKLHALTLNTDSSAVKL